MQRSLEPKYQLFLNKHEQTDIKYFRELKFSLNIQTILEMLIQMLMIAIPKRS